MKKQLATVFLTFMLGLTLVGGGTFAYFSDTVESNNTFASGTLDLSASPETIVDIENMKPGDYVYRTFELTNGGTLDIGQVLIETSYSVNDAEGNNGGKDFGEHIEVEFLYNQANNDEVIFRTTLAELTEMSPEAIDQRIMYPWYGEEGLPAGSTKDFVVKFNFVENGEAQNVFQGDSLELKWQFKALQENGEEIE